MLSAERARRSCDGLAARTRSGAPRDRGARLLRRRCLVAPAALLVFSACASAPPLAVKPVDAKVTRDQRRVNAVASGIVSDSTRIMLRRNDLLELNDVHPEDVIERLHEHLVSEAVPDAELVFALAELSFVLAEKGDPAPTPAAGEPGAADDLIVAGRSARGRYLAAAIYAWAYLFAESDRDRASIIDPRAPIAAALYNRSILAAFTTPNGAVDLRAGRYGLPHGVLDLSFDTDTLVWGDRHLTGFQSSSNFEVVGLRNRYRKNGLGAPLIANALPLTESPGRGDLELSETVVGATAVLHFSTHADELLAGNLSARLELFRGREAESVEIAGHEVPLEVEPSAALAATLERSGVWRDELLAFLGRAAGVERKHRLFALEPMQQGQMPVVFVHGTNSNPSVWANMANDLQSDAAIREHFSFWFYAYDSGNPILYSGMQFRRALDEVTSTLRGRELGVCLDEMIVIGHSQGGLLTKLTAIDSGDRFWTTISSRPFEQVRMRSETRAELREAIFVEPLPYVRRVVFISTPHRGSFLAGPDFVRRLASRLIQLPTDLMKMSVDIARIRESVSTELQTAHMVTSLDNMSPGNAFIETIAEIPVAPAIASHSIVSVSGAGPPEGLDDGVVRYESAHRTDVDSERIVRSGHSSQSNPNTVNEVERILRLQLRESSCSVRPGELVTN